MTFRSLYGKQESLESNHTPSQDDMIINRIDKNQVSDPSHYCYYYMNTSIIYNTEPLKCTNKNTSVILLEIIISVTHTQHWLLVDLHYTPLWSTLTNLCAQIQIKSSTVIA